MNQPTLSRRTALSLLGSGTAALALQACTRGAPVALAPAAPQPAAAFLDACAWQLIELSPEGATSLGVDTGAHAALRSRLGDRSAAGQRRIADVLRDALRKSRSTSGENLDPATRTSLAVVESAFSTALDGFALP